MGVGERVRPQTHTVYVRCFTRGVCKLQGAELQKKSWHWELDLDKWGGLVWGNGGVHKWEKGSGWRRIPGRGESRSTKFHVWLCAGSSKRLQSKFRMGNYGPLAWNSQCLNFILWACNSQIYIYIFKKQQNPFYQLTFSSAESTNWLELNAESFGWRGSLMPNSALHTHTHTYTHKHTDTHIGPGSSPRTQSFKGHGLKVLWWRQGFRKCFTGAGSVPLCSQRVTVLEWEGEPLTRPTRAGFTQNHPVGLSIWQRLSCWAVSTEMAGPRSALDP